MLRSAPWILVLCLATIQARWTEQQAAEWYQQYDWGAGVNYTPAYADNEIQFWEELDLNEIDK
jgi:hypothetical protein